MQQTEAILGGRRAIGTIAYIGKDQNFEKFTWAWGQLIAFCYEYLVPPGYYIHIDHGVESGQIDARNSLVYRMQGDWLMQVDTDEDFEPDLVFRMLQLFEGQNLDVLTGVYNFKQEPYNPVLFQYHLGEYRAMVDWDRNQDIKLLPIGAAGGGALLVRRRVFDRIKNEQHAQAFDPQPPFKTDDFNFFERCRLLGIKSYCAPKIELEHLMVRGIGMKNYDASQFQTSSSLETQAMV